MKGQEIIRRAQAIGVTFSATDDGDVVCEGRISSHLADFIRDNTSQIHDAMRPERRVIDFQAEREKRGVAEPGGAPGRTARSTT